MLYTSLDPQALPLVARRVWGPDYSCMYAKAECDVAETLCDFSTYTQAQEQAESPP